VGNEVITERFPIADIGNSFAATLLATGISEPALDAAGEPLWLPARPKLGETRQRPALHAQRQERLKSALNYWCRLGDSNT
jgi:hypothetical protein